VWKVNASGYAIPPLPTGPNLKLYIHRHRDELPEEDRNDPTLMAKFELWLDLLANKRQAAIDAYEGPICPALFNRTNRHAWWEGRNYWEDIANLRVALPPPTP
jgi:hypothetical protein